MNLNVMAVFNMELTKKGKEIVSKIDSMVHVYKANIRAISSTLNMMFPEKIDVTISRYKTLSHTELAQVIKNNIEEFEIITNKTLRKTIDSMDVRTKLISKESEYVEQRVQLEFFMNIAEYYRKARDWHGCIVSEFKKSFENDDTFEFASLPRFEEELKQLHNEITLKARFEYENEQDEWEVLTQVASTSHNGWHASSTDIGTYVKSFGDISAVAAPICETDEVK